MVMDTFTRLAQVTQRENKKGELPDFIVPLLMRIAENPREFLAQEEIIKELVARVEEYDPISNYCCEKIGYNLQDIHTILDRLRVSY